MLRLFFLFFSFFFLKRIPPKRACLSFLTSLLRAPMGFDWLQYDFAHSCVNALPAYLYKLQLHQPSTSTRVLSLLLDCGRFYGGKALDFDALQYGLVPFYHSTRDKDGGGTVEVPGPFVALPLAAQTKAVECLHYFSRLTPPLLRALVACLRSDALGTPLKLYMLEIVAQQVCVLCMEFQCCSTVNC